MKKPPTPAAALDVLDSLDPKRFIVVKGARVHNLKNLSVAIPRNSLVVITGLSGSGKSSLAFNTLFAEGQRLYVESLSAYARQFLGRMEKPDVDYIRGLAPAIAIEQRVNTRNPRSTVGTVTEIYDYLKLLFARVGKTYSPKSQQEVKKDTASAVFDYICRSHNGASIMISCPVRTDEGDMKSVFSQLLSKGFARVLVDGKPSRLEQLMESDSPPSAVELLIDRTVVNATDKEVTFRLFDSLETAFLEGDGVCFLHLPDQRRLSFSSRFELDGITFAEPSPHLFSFNSPYGACSTCEGFGRAMVVSEDLVIPDKDLSIYEGAVAPWRGKSGHKWLTPLLSLVDFPLHRPYALLSAEERTLLWNGNAIFEGINGFFERLKTESYKVQNRVTMARYRGFSVCPDCRGSRLRKEALYVKVGGASIADLTLMPLKQLGSFFYNLQLDPHEQKVAERIITEVQTRLNCALSIGLGYLTLNRAVSTLSGGEFQRIKLTTSLGSALVGSMYVMDEPSIGLHPKDIAQMVAALQSLRDLGNTVIVVEHEEEVMRAADQLIDIGPEAGAHGGQLVFQGTPSALESATGSHTADYLTGRSQIALPLQRRKWSRSVTLRGAKTHNLHRLDVVFPLHALTVVTGVSGSGKSTLINKTLAPALSRALGAHAEEQGQYDRLEGDVSSVSRIEFVDQNPIGRSARSNPMSYVKAYDIIRDLFAAQPLSVQRGYTGARFSFNLEGGRCEACQGEGEIRVEMQFMADLFLLCEECGGKRFKKDTLEVTYRGKNIAETLDMTVDEAMEFFTHNKPAYHRIAPLAEVGLGYVKLGQSSNSLSGGEAQRVKLASFLSKKGSAAREHILFIFDEPTTGLHFHDINKLLYALNRLVDEGHSVIIIEHNMEVIKCADWIIDLGPEGGEEGGRLMFEGTPEELAARSEGYTAQFLREKIKRPGVAS